MPVIHRCMWDVIIHLPESGCGPKHGILVSATAIPSTAP
jgi:hypothetical protein